MEISQIRNATFMVGLGVHRILVDPMLSPPGSLPGFRMFRGERRRNPLTEMPTGGQELIESATEVLITHEHPDHLDPPGVEWIAAWGLKVWAGSVDVPNLKRKGLDARDVEADDLGELSVEVVPATHGHGVIGWLMGPVSGYFLAYPGEPTLYITGDAVLNETVKHAIERLRPQVIVAPAGTANFGVGKDLMFSEAELIELVRLAPGKVVFNHLESIDHCPMTRESLRKAMDQAGLGDRVLIPNDGERLELQDDPTISHASAGRSPQHKPGFQKWLTAKFAGT